jgi:lipopolysaccharide/colanic/teichoic acid biosynthesis glycosyltransferase
LCYKGSRGQTPGLAWGLEAVAGWGPLRRLSLISIDLLFVALATIIAVMLRGYFDTVSDSLVALMPYSFISLGCASVIFLVGGLDRTPWRYSSVADHLQVIVLTMLAVVIALVITFALNRLQPVARSLPVLQAGLIVSILIGARSAARFWHTRQIHSDGNARVSEQPHETVLVVGVNTVTELFLLSLREFASQRLQVAGILAEEPGMQGRAIQQTPVLGTVEQLQEILRSLEVHGLTVDRIVVTTAADRLRPVSLENLLVVEKSSDIVVQFLSERLGFDVPPRPSVQRRNIVPEQRAVARVGGAIDADRTTYAAKSFPLGKRIVDLFGAALLVLMLTPVAVLVALVVVLDVGFPLISWQQRPGLHGRPFKLYKFRTMRAPHDGHQRRIPNEQRSSAVGQILRRARLDELPQLYNVLVGDMSLIGPRPLLPCDQSPDYAARLFVRPGMTGWAQVNGGRIISPSDKLMLDVWYVKNASVALDLKIVLSTVTMILFGDRINPEAVNLARNELGLKTLLRTTMIPAE